MSKDLYINDSVNDPINVKIILQISRYTLYANECLRIPFLHSYKCLRTPPVYQRFYLMSIH